MCSNLINIDFPDNLITHIGKCAFSECDKLIQYAKLLPENVKNYPDFLLAGLKNTNHRSHLRQNKGPGPKYEFKGETQCDYGPELCGISMEQIEDLLSHPLIERDPEMKKRDVVKKNQSCYRRMWYWIRTTHESRETTRS